MVSGISVFLMCSCNIRNELNTSSVMFSLLPLSLPPTCSFALVEEDSKIRSCNNIYFTSKSSSFIFISNNICNCINNAASLVSFNTFFCFSSSSSLLCNFVSPIIPSVFNRSLIIPFKSFG